MTDDPPPVPARHAQRVQAVLALFRGKSVADVGAQYRMCRSDLYKYRQRALTATNPARFERLWR